MADGEKSIFSSNHLLAYYGNPSTGKMGILGDRPPEKIAELLKIKADEYDGLNGEKGAIAAFHLVYATVQPAGNVSFIKKEVVEKYIKIAKERKMLVILDHQIGRYSVEKSIADLLAYAHYENVHFAIDPEWRTNRPGKEMGTPHNSSSSAHGFLLCDSRCVGQEKMLILPCLKAKILAA